MTLELLLTQPGAESNVIFSFSRKRCRTGFFILKTSNLFSKSLIKRELWKNSTLFGFSVKVLGCQ